MIENCGNVHTKFRNKDQIWTIHQEIHVKVSIRKKYETESKNLIVK